MKLRPFELERFFARYEFSVKYLLSSSDCDGINQWDVLALADTEIRDMWDTLSLGYTESLGHTLLRAEIAGLYRGISSDDCLVVVPEEGIFIALNSILKSGDHVISTFPGYQSLYEVALGLGCEVTRWEPEEENGWCFYPDFLEKTIKPNTRMIIVNFPHNPTGYLPPRGDFEKIINLAKEHNIFLFSDEMYRLLEYDEKDRLPSACELYEKAISLFGMSKTFGMAGVRIGWLVTKDKEVFSKLASFKDYTTICSSAPSEVLSIIALRVKERIIFTHKERIQRNLKLLDSFFDQNNELFNWVKPKAGTIAFPKLKGDKKAMEFCQQVIDKANIMLLPSTVYDYGNTHFRLGFGRENMPEALSKLQDYLIAIKNPK